MSEITVLDKLKAAERELALRRNVYPGRIATRKMSREKAAREVALMEAIVADYRASVTSELNLGATGDFPQGKLDNTDEGGIQIAVHSDRGIVRVEFGKPVAWLGLDAPTAIALAASLAHHAAKESG